MAAPESSDQQGPSLHDEINELESLLAGRPAATPASRIPVLDELAGVEGRDTDAGPTSAGEKIDPRQLAEIARHLEHRLESELADLANVIRGVLKRCILDELRTYLPRTGSSPPGTSDPEHVAMHTDQPVAPHGQQSPD